MSWEFRSNWTTEGSITGFNYDALGRVTNQVQKYLVNANWTAEYAINSSYDLAGHVISQTYPSGHTVSYTYDSTGGASSFTGNLGEGGTQRTYSSEISYSPLGGVTKEKLGTDTALYNKLFYNSRGQLAEIRVGTYNPTDATWWNRGAIINHYSNSCWGMCGGSTSTTSMTDNNGNLKKQEVFVPNNESLSSSTSWWQGYDYDALNRLQRVHEYTGNTGLDWQQEYVYDRYGNRTIAPEAAKTWGPGINNKQFTVNTANNRLGVPSGQSGTMSYDAAGNLTSDTYSAAAVTRAYDAENRMTSETQANSYVAGSYTYDAEGRRVKRTVGGQPSAVETWQIYGISGELLAEYPANGSPSSPQKEYGYRNGQLLLTASCPAVAAKLTLSGATASSYYTSGNEPAKAIDGTTTTLWNAGTFAPAWIQVDLGQSYNLSQVRLLTAQYPDGHTTHEIYGGPSPSSMTLLGTVDGSTTSSQWLQLTTGATNVRYVKVLTTASPSWVAWFEVEVYGTATSSSPAEINWLVTDQLGTPRLIFDKSGALATTKRHDYLPFGEEIYNGVRSSAMGYAANDTTRQKFTQKERDIETGLDYFAARYYSSTQGRFTGADPYDINLERQKTTNKETADSLFEKYLNEPQHWNHYSYVLNNPLKYVDPDGLFEEKVDLLGKKITIKIDEKIRKKDPKLFNKIKQDIYAAVAKINEAKNLTPDQLKQVHKLNGLKVSADIGSTGMHKPSGYFEMKPHWAGNQPSVDFFAGGILHDNGHQGQGDPEIDSDKYIENEKAASKGAADIARKIPLDAAVIKWLDDDALTGHLFNGKLPSSRPPKNMKQ